MSTRFTKCPCCGSTKEIHVLAPDWVIPGKVFRPGACYEYELIALTAELDAMRDMVSVDVKEFAFLKVRKSSMPPNASLVVCYDDGSGIPQIGDDLYSDYVVVPKKEEKP